MKLKDIHAKVEGRRAAFKISSGPVLVVGLEAANSSASVGGRTAIASFIGPVD